jgi:hypothetical protein
MKVIILSVLTALVMCTASAQTNDPDGQSRWANHVDTLAFKHGLCTGMTFANVVASRGEPQCVDRAYSKYGARESWWMKNGLRVNFLNGRVISFD